MKRASMWMACAATTLVAVPAMAGDDDVQSQLVEMQKLVRGLQQTVDAQAEQLEQQKQKADAQAEQLEHQGKLLEDAQRVVRADEQDSKSGLAAFLDSIEVTGAAAASYNFNFNTPTDGSGGANQNIGQSGIFLPFQRDANSFQVDEVWFGLAKPVTEESRGGFHFDIFYGATASNYASNFSASGPDTKDSASDFVVAQAYVEYLAPVADVNLKLGKFLTPLGSETAGMQWVNFNITRGILNTIQPVDHVGFYGTVPISEFVELGAGVVNSAWTAISSPDDSEEKSYLVSVKMGDGRANVRGSFFYGSEPTFVGNFSGPVPAKEVGDQVGLVDVVAWFNPTDNLSLSADYDYLYVENTGYYLNGVALAGRVGITDQFGLALRGEYLREDSSPNHGALIFTGVGTHATDAWSVTGTADYALTEHLKLKSELRWDRANGNGEAGSNNQFAESNPDDFSSLDQLIWLAAAEYVF